ncbi:electron transfer flavoprotein subunit alpha/FixB family protein [Pseudomonas citronellolis]|uniref:electron transfer flavoprotein subunit alpha/FixB family protein n=1 Tax=Pseudomonas citronellolis TaxID=53408 RepID=UPI0023E3EFEE|nr:FAD-binding protein [Pseudomonas citronellolis]MDF3933170.1 FAD-binding protein [Pseudomonas citronellolis]
MSILVIADGSRGADAGRLSAATRSTLAAARLLGDEIDLLVAGEGVAAVARDAARAEGVSRVLLADAPAYAGQLAENLAALVLHLAGPYSHILAPATLDGKNYLPRIAALLDVDQLSDITAVLAPDTFKRPIFAGNAVATVQSSASVKVISVRPTAFDAVAEGGGEAPVLAVDGPGDGGLAALVEETLLKSERPELGAARVIVAGGRGLQSREGFAMLYPLADRLGAAVGASLAAVDAGFAPSELQVGQSGRIVAPQLYLAIGISGAVQHVAGMKDSATIAAINLDPDAPIFEVADYGLVGDLFELLPELLRELG